MNYCVVTESSSEEAMEELNSILDDQGKPMQRLRLSRGNGKRKIFFTVEGTHSEHEQLMGRLRQSPELHGFEATADRQNE